MNDDTTLQKYIANLAHEDWKVRRDAAHALAQIKDARAVPALIEMLKDEDPTCRLVACGALGEIKDVRSVEPLIAILEEPGEFYLIYSSAGRALRRIEGVRSMNALTKALNSENPLTRFAVAWVLGMQNDIRTVPVLIEALGAEREGIRFDSARVLNRFGDAKTLPRAILSERSFSSQQRVAILSSLRGVNCKYNISWKKYKTLRYRFPDTRTLCQQMQKSVEQDVREAGTEVLIWLEENGDLLRASQRNTKADNTELLRATGATRETKPETLLRPSIDTPKTQPMTQKKKNLRERLIRLWKRDED